MSVIVLRLTAKAETPIAISRRAEVGNVYETLPEIPGSALRGAWAGRYVAQQGWEGSVPDQDAEGFAALFENGAVRFGPLRPLPPQWEREPFDGAVVPVPRSARSCKYHPGFARHGVYDRLMAQARRQNQTGEEERTEFQCPHEQCGAPREPFESDWVAVRWARDGGGSVAVDYDAIADLSTHTAICEGLADEGRLFSLRHFPAETEFTGWLVAPDETKKQRLLDAIGWSDSGVTLRVGRRHHSLGALCLTDVTATSTEELFAASHGPLDSRWKAFQDLHLQPGCHLFSLTLLTDTILVDDFLRPYRALSECWLAEQFNVEKDQVKRLVVFTGTRVVRGWNSAHRLPKEPDVAMTAGSVFLFAVAGLDGDALKSRLGKWEREGLGLRRSEGFGQVLACDPWHLTGSDGRVRLDSVKPKPPSATVVDHAVWDFVQGNASELQKAEGLTSTQLHGLRDEVHRATEMEAITGDKGYLARAAQRKKSGAAWRITLPKEQGTELQKVLRQRLAELKMEQARRWVDDFVTATLIVKEKGDLRPPNGNVKKEVKP